MTPVFNQESPVIWTVQLDGKRYQPYARKLNKAVEKAWITGKGELHVKFKLWEVVIIFFSDWIQFKVCPQFTQTRREQVIGSISNMTSQRVTLPVHGSNPRITMPHLESVYEDLQNLSPKLPCTIFYINNHQRHCGFSIHRYHCKVHRCYCRFIRQDNKCHYTTSPAW
eukprot:m.299398 g.299398  ORF g.299398 m.299398 type:complete len:168 (+) comp16413_c0_seq11:140-643(+)